jgi:ABC-2 type transport system permease protein
VIAQLRSELLKQRSTLTTLYLFLAMIGFVALATALHVVAMSTTKLSTHAHQVDVFQVGTRAGIIFAGLAGALAITAEIRYGTIRPTFLVAPRRSPVVAAKLAVAGLVGIVYGLLAEGLMAAAAAIGFSARGIPNLLSSGDYVRILAGGAAAAALWAILGVGIGALVRNQVATLVGLLSWMFLVETTSEAFVPGAARFTPGSAGVSLAGTGDHKLSLAVAALLLIGYAAATSAAGWIGTLRRDVA